MNIDQNTRLVLTIICMVVVGFGVMQLYLAERAADRVYVKLGGSGRRIRRRISRGKRFIMWMGIFMIPAIQPWTDSVPYLEDLPVRPLFFMAAVICFALGANDICVGYIQWDDDMDTFLDG